jgi:hypothetical protein
MFEEGDIFYTFTFYTKEIRKGKVLRLLENEVDFNFKGINYVVEFDDNPYGQLPLATYNIVTGNHKYMYVMNIKYMQKENRFLLI